MEAAAIGAFIAAVVALIFLVRYANRRLKNR
jgi:hypothetical protein